MNESNQQFSNSNVNASTKSRLALTLFAFFLGYLGVDRFYGGEFYWESWNYWLLDLVGFEHLLILF